MPPGSATSSVCCRQRPHSTSRSLSTGWLSWSHPRATSCRGGNRRRGGANPTSRASSMTCIRLAVVVALAVAALAVLLLLPHAHSVRAEGDAAFTDLGGGPRPAFAPRSPLFL